VLARAAVVFTHLVGNLAGGILDVVGKGFLDNAEVPRSLKVLNLDVKHVLDFVVVEEGDVGGASEL